MFAKQLEEYQRNFLETRYVSQLITFLIALFSMLSLYSLLRAGYSFPEYVKSHWESYSISIVFHILVVFFFGLRFVLLFFSSKKFLVITISLDY